MYELQTASMWKRISAALFDMILLAMTVVGLAYVISSALQYDSYTDQLSDIRESYEAEYGVELDITLADYEALTEEEHALYEQANQNFAQDEEAIRLHSLILNFTFIIITFSILFGYLILEFTVPLLFGNGQTLGKKIFGIGVMRIDGVKVSPLLMFARTVLGKFTVETMIPVMIVVMMYFGLVDLKGTVIIGAMFLGQLILVAATKTHTPLHDKLAQTVTVDFASQRIFDSVEELEAYRAKMRAEAAANT